MAFQKKRPDPALSVRHFYGSEVLRLREERGWSLARLAAEALSSPATLSRVESGEYRVPEGLSEQLDRVFETGGHFMRLLPLARRENRPSNYQEFFALADQALIDESYSPSMPGLLQTESFARCALQAGLPFGPAEEVEERVRFRLGRQARMRNSQACQYWFILDESAFARVYGGPEVMAGQLQAVLDAAKLPNVTIQLLPFAAGGHSEVAALWLFTLRDGTRVAYEESSHAGRIFEEAEEVKKRGALYNLLRAQALSPRDTERVLGAMLEGMTADAP
ncbi:helix-turn-helix domain-containing protein [Kitasatospora sp. NPDC004272]